RVSPPSGAVRTAKLVFRQGSGSGAGRVMAGVCSDRPDPRWRLWITHLTPDTSAVGAPPHSPSARRPSKSGECQRLVPATFGCSTARGGLVPGGWGGEAV